MPATVFTRSAAKDDVALVALHIFKVLDKARLTSAALKEFFCIARVAPEQFEFVLNCLALLVELSLTDLRRLPTASKS